MKTLAPALAALLLAPLAGAAEEASKIPIREITAFKDGHALVLRSGLASVDDDHRIRIRDLPRPVLGTFWPDVKGEGLSVGAVTVEHVDAPVTRPASSTEAMLRANVGRRIIYRDAWDEIRSGELVEIIEREPREIPGSPQQYYDNATRTHRYRATTVAVPGETLVVIRETDAVATLPIASIHDLRFEGGMPARAVERTEKTEQMTIALETDGSGIREADVSLMYLEKGVRWVPSYRMTILEDDRLLVELQASVVNELADLSDVTMHFAIGVPRFTFENVPDPLAMREVFDDLGMFFRERTGNETGGMLALTTVTSQGGGGGGGSIFGNTGAQAGGPEAPKLLGGGRTEDLYVFTVKGVSLREGGRMAIPLLRYELPMEQLYTLDLPVTIPQELRRNLSHTQQQELGRILGARYPRHALRITNDNPEGHPITTASALIVRDGRTLAQGIIGYTAPGGVTDLEVGVAVDIEVDEEELETGRKPDAHTWNGNLYTQTDVRHSARVTNHKSHPITLEYRKFAFGTPSSVSEPGRSRTLPSYTDEIVWPDTVGHGWRWWSWPHYWRALNPPAVYSWSRTLEPGETFEYAAEWHFYTP